MNNAELGSCAHDNTPFFVGEDIPVVISTLSDLGKLCQWFNLRQTKENLGMCKFICFCNVNIMFKNKKLATVLLKSILGVFLDSNYTSQLHIGSICDKIPLKLNTILRITLCMVCMDFNKKQLAINFFFSFKFNYCPLIRICHNKPKDDKINRLRER